MQHASVELLDAAKAHLALERVRRKLLVELGTRRRLRGLQLLGAGRQYVRDALDESPRTQLLRNLLATRKRLDECKLATLR